MRVVSQKILVVQLLLVLLNPDVEGWLRDLVKRNEMRKPGFTKLGLNLN